MKKSKKDKRLARAKRARYRQKALDILRLVVNRTPRHIYAQVIESGDQLKGTCDKVLLSASTVEKSVKSDLSQTGNTDAAKALGKLIAERAKEKGIKKVAFDRSGNKYHGRVKALADSARENGLQI